MSDEKKNTELQETPSIKKWDIPGYGDSWCEFINENERKQFISLVGRLYGCSSEEVPIKNIVKKALVLHVRLALLKDNMLETLVNYSIENDVNSFLENGRISPEIIKHVFNNRDEKDELYVYLKNYKEKTYKN